MMMIARYSGLLLPFVTWAATTQLGQILPYLDCTSGWSRMGITMAVAVAVVLASLLLPLRSAAGAETRMGWFLRNLSLMIGLVLSFAIGLQAVASLMVNPCLR